MKLKTPPCRRVEQPEGHDSREGREETEAEEYEEGEEAEGDRDGDTPRGEMVEFTRVGGDVPLPMENADLPLTEGGNKHRSATRPQGVGRRWKTRKMRITKSMETGTERPQGGSQSKSHAWGGMPPP